MEFRCPCCNHSDYSVVGTHLVTTRTGRPLFDGASELSLSLNSCSNCSHVVVHPLPPLREIYKYYESIGYWRYHALSDDFARRSWLENLTYNGGLWERYFRARLHLRVIQDHVRLGRDARIADLGSGLSPFLYHCRDQGFTNLYALEPSEDICRYLEAQGITVYPTILEDFVERRDLPRFDVMLFSHALEHIGEPEVVLRGLRRLLTDRGVLLVVVPYQDHLRPFTAGLHLHFFNEGSLKLLLKGCGYEAVSVQRDRLNAFERALLGAIHQTYDTLYANKRVTATQFLTSRWLEGLHRFGWRPLKRLLRLKINIYLSVQELRALARGETRGAAAPTGETSRGS